MQPSSNTKPSTDQTYSLSQEDRKRLYQLLNDLDSDKLRLVLKKNTRNSTSLNELESYTRAQLFQECISLINNFYSRDLEQTLYDLRQQSYSLDFCQQLNQLNSQSSLRQEESSFHAQTSQALNGQQKLRPLLLLPITQQLQAKRSTTNSAEQIRNHDHNHHHPQQKPLNQQTSNINSTFSHPQQNSFSIPTTARIPNSSSSPISHHYQIPLLPIPSTVPSTTLSISSHHTPTSLVSSKNQNFIENKITFKTLPFYRTMACIYERSHIFHYDTYRKQHIANDDFILPVDVCNQLSLSYDYDPAFNIYKTSKSLLLRIARIDQPPTFNEQYEDSLPPNIVVVVNGQSLSNLPTPKPYTRQQSDLLRVGREIDITSHVMFNPILKNEIKIAWSYRQDNTTLQRQYANALYALHIYLAERLTVEALCEKVISKPARFFRQDSIKLLAKACIRDHDFGLEVSDQKLKLICPIDQRRLKTPIRATTCQHLQCFDLTNYIALNEKSNKWICPVCNRFALFDDLQIDLHTASILNSIKDEQINEITVSSDLEWKPIIPPNIENQSMPSKTNATQSSNDLICIDDE